MICLPHASKLLCSNIRISTPRLCPVRIHYAVLGYFLYLILKFQPSAELDVMDYSHDDSRAHAQTHKKSKPRKQVLGLPSS